MGVELRAGLKDPRAVAIQTLLTLQPCHPLLDRADAVARQSLRCCYPPKLAVDPCPSFHQVQSTAEPLHFGAAQSMWRYGSAQLWGLPKLGNRSVSGSIVAAPLAREPILGIDPTIGVSSDRGGHALGVAGKLA